MLLTVEVEGKLLRVAIFCHKKKKKIDFNFCQWCYKIEYKSQYNIGSKIKKNILELDAICACIIHNKNKFQIKDYHSNNFYE